MGEDSRVEVDHPVHGRWLVETGTFRTPREEPGPPFQEEAAAPREGSPADLGRVDEPGMAEAEEAAIRALGVEKEAGEVQSKA